MINTKHIKNSFERAFNENITILEEKPDLIKVRGASGNIYIIRKTEDQKICSCSCPHFFFRRVACKHMVKASLLTNKEISEFFQMRHRQ